MDGVQIRVGDDGMNAYVSISETHGEITAYALSQELDAHKISFGVDKELLETLERKPVCDAEITVATGKEAVNGEDGYVIFHVEKSTEYKPDYGGDGEAVVDYKNVDIFQMAEKGRVLCEAVRPTHGKDGISVFGTTITAVPGKASANPRGKNTEWDEEGRFLLASEDGVISFNGTVINIVEVLNINGDVDLSTGNIRFKGDVNVRGSISDGFLVECGGNLTVRGRVGSATLNVGGNLLVSEGMNMSKQPATVAGFVKSRYIEGCDLYVKGDIYTDYLMDSQVECEGNIVLAGKKSVILGGETTVRGELSVNYIGNEHGIKTSVRLMRSQIDTEKLEKLEIARKKLEEEIRSHTENVERIRHIVLNSDDPESDLLYKQLMRQLPDLNESHRLVDAEIRSIENVRKADFPGCIRCKRILYAGVSISAGENDLFRDHNDLNHCRLYVEDGEWKSAPAGK